jgi:glutathionylspermidine synthase
VKRVAFTPRPHWREQCEELGFTFHSIDGVYWDESAAYELTLAQVETLEDASEDLHQRYLAAVAWVIENQHFEPFDLPAHAIALITDSWHRQDPALYGRFDFSWNGHGAPKLLEYNADTPTSLLEASVVQWYWLRDVLPEADQFNSIHEKLIARWKEIAQGQRMHFAAIDGHEEDTGNARYMQDVAHQAGVQTSYLPIEAIGFDGQGFVDLDGQPINRCFKLYPWEWLLQDEFSEHLASSALRFQEPAWKMLMSSKAMLPILWQLNPEHPNLLAASFAEDLPGRYVRKPLYSREGQNIRIVAGEHSQESDGPHADGRFIYQAYAPLARFADSYTVLGSWMVGDKAAGLGIREDASPITRDSSRFLPHYFID